MENEVRVALMFVGLTFVFGSIILSDRGATGPSGHYTRTIQYLIVACMLGGFAIVCAALWIPV